MTSACFALAAAGSSLTLAQTCAGYSRPIAARTARRVLQFMLGKAANYPTPSEVARGRLPHRCSNNGGTGISVRWNGCARPWAMDRVREHAPDQKRAVDDVGPPAATILYVPRRG
jgi:hypothetical protein